MTAPRGAWIIAPDGRGTSADVAALRGLLDGLHESCGPASSKWLVHGDERVSDTSIQLALKEIASFDGPRLVWIVGDAVEAWDYWYLKTNLKPTIRLRDIWEKLGIAADSKPAHPIVAVVDVCHAGDGFDKLPQNLVAFAACADDEKARADGSGGWLTRQLIAALTTLPSEITAHTLQGYLDQARTDEGLGNQRPKVHLGHHTSLVLNRRPGATALAAQPAQFGYLDRQALNELVEAIKQLGLCDLERLKQLREHLGEVRFDMPDRSTALLQLNEDLLRLNRLPTAPGQMPQLAIWLDQARALAGSSGTAVERLLVRLRNRVQGRKETLAVRHIAPSDRTAWAEQLAHVLGVHPDFDFDVAELRPGEIADLVFIFLGARIDPARAELAERILDSPDPPPLLLIQSGDPDWEHLEEAKTIRVLKEKAGNLASASTLPAGSTFTEIVQGSLPALIEQVETPRDEVRRRAERSLALANLGSTIKWADEGFERANQEAQVVFDAENYDEALQCYRSLDEKLRAQPTGDAALDRHRLARTQLNIACCLANQQKPDEARAVLDELSEEDVASLRHGDDKALVVLASALLVVERVERARRLIEAHDLDGQPRQLLMLADQGGRAPDNASESALSLAVNQALLDTRMDDAADDAVRLMADAGGALSVLLGLRGAIRALEGTVIWAAVRSEIPIDRREALVDQILVTLGRTEEPTREPHRGIWEALKYSWDQLTWWEAPPAPPASLDGRIETVQLPWLEAYNEVAEHMVAGRREDGLEAARRAAKRFPRREPCQRVLAGVTLELDLPEECLAAALRAFELLPVPRNRALFAAVLTRLERFDEAWSVASKLEGQLHPQAARVRAIAAHHHPSAELTIDDRVAAWHAYLELQPDHHAAWLGPVQLYQRAGRIEEAQDAALVALERHDFDVDTVADVARLLMLKGDRRDALSALMKRLQAIGGPRAEQVQLDIAHRIGQAADYEPDWDALIQSGAAKAVPFNQAAEFLLSRLKAADALMTSYNAGRLSAATLVELTGLTSAHLVKGAQANQHRLSQALTPGVPTPISDAQPEEWLVDGLTLHTMAATGLIPTLEAKLQAGHRLVLFEDTLQQIAMEPSVLSSRAEPRKLEQLRAVQAFLSRWYPPEPALADDELLATREGAALLAWGKDVDLLSPEQLARQLIPWLDHDPDAVKRLERWADPAAIAELPPAIILGDGLWNTPDETYDLLRGVRAAGRAIHWTAKRHEALNRAIEALEVVICAAELATQVLEFVARSQTAGFLAVEAAPEVDVPPAGEIDFLNTAFAHDLAYREFLKGAPSRRWIGADFLPFAWFSGAAPADLVRHTGKWTFERWTEVSQTYSTIVNQLVAVDAWAVLVGAPQKCLDALLSLGFVEALDVGALRRFERRGVDEPKVLEVFSRLEAMATNSQHAGAKVARIALARRYAGNMRSLWLGDGVGQSWSSETRLTHFLLRRLEGPLSALPGPSGLLFGLLIISSAILDSPEQAISRQDDSYVVSHTSPSGRLVHAVVEWARELQSRLASILRVLADMLLLTHDLHQARLPILLDLFAEPLIPPRSGFSIPAVLDSAALIGVLWPTDPIDAYGFEVDGTTISYGDMFELATAAFQNETPRLNEALLQIGVPIEPTAGVRETFWSPAEALLLRSPPDLVQTLAQDFALWAAPSDGQLAALALQLATSPENPSTREAFARHAVVSPWRLVRRDPRQFLSWGQTALLPSNWPASVTDLCALLSETISVEEDGVWSAQRVAWLNEQPAAQEFVYLWGEVPGDSFANAAIQIALHSADPASTFARVQAVLESPDEHPAGRLALHLLVGRLLAARHRVLSVDGVEIDLPAWLTAILPTLVLTVCQDSSSQDCGPTSTENERSQPEAKLGEVEVDLLLICRFVLIQFPDINSTRPKELVWLLFRLHGWLIHQLEKLPPKRRAESISALRVELGKLPHNKHRWPDAFDPKRFEDDPRRYRSLVLLCALLGMEQLATQIRDEQTEAFDPTSDALLEHLGRIIEQPLNEEELQSSRLDPTTHLEWNAPVAASALALRVLLQFRATHWSRLAESTRSRWFRHLHDSDGPSAKKDRLILWSIIAANAESMTDSERQQARQWLEAESSWSLHHANAWLGLALEDPLQLSRAEDSIHALEDQQSQAYLFGRLLRVYGRRAPEQLEEVIKAEIERIQASGRDPVPLVAGVAALLNETNEQLQAHASAVLTGLLAQEPYHSDERLTWVRSIMPE